MVNTPRNKLCYDIAGIHATLGNTELALKILRDKSCLLCCALELYITHDPFFKNLWELDEFKEIIEIRTAAKREIRRELALSEFSNN